MKKSLSIILVLALTLCLCACGGESKTENNNVLPETTEADTAMTKEKLVEEANQTDIGRSLGEDDIGKAIIVSGPPILVADSFCELGPNMDSEYWVPSEIPNVLNVFYRVYLNEEDLQIIDGKNNNIQLVGIIESIEEREAMLVGVAGFTDLTITLSNGFYIGDE